MTLTQGLLFRGRRSLRQSPFRRLSNTRRHDWPDKVGRFHARDEQIVWRFARLVWTRVVLKSTCSSGWTNRLQRRTNSDGLFVWKFVLPVFTLRRRVHLRQFVHPDDLFVSCVKTAIIRSFSKDDFNTEKSVTWEQTFTKLWHSWSITIIPSCSNYKMLVMR